MRLLFSSRDHLCAAQIISVQRSSLCQRWQREEMAERRDGSQRWRRSSRLVYCRYAIYFFSYSYKNNLFGLPLYLYLKAKSLKQHISAVHLCHIISVFIQRWSLDEDRDDVDKQHSRDVAHLFFSLQKKATQAVYIANLLHPSILIRLFRCQIIYLDKK